MSLMYRQCISWAISVTFTCLKRSYKHVIVLRRLSLEKCLFFYDMEKRDIAFVRIHVVRKLNFNDFTKMSGKFRDGPSGGWKGVDGP